MYSQTHLYASKLKGLYGGFCTGCLLWGGGTQLTQLPVFVLLSQHHFLLPGIAAARTLPSPTCPWDPELQSLSFLPSLCQGQSLSLKRPPMVETVKKEIERANLLCQLILGMGCPDIYLTLSVRTETGKVRHNQGQLWDFFDPTRYKQSYCLTNTYSSLRREKVTKEITREQQNYYSYHTPEIELVPPQFKGWVQFSGLEG